VLKYLVYYLTKVRT